MAEEKKDKIEKNEDSTVEKTEDVRVEKVKVKKKKKGARTVTVGNAYVTATFNNTMITITDLSGAVIASGSAGTMGYTGSKKSTPYVAGLIANSVSTKAKGFGLTEVNVYVKGIGSGRESAVRGLQSSGINVTSIKDITPLPHNGCKRPRPRRV